MICKQQNYIHISDENETLNCTSNLLLNKFKISVQFYVRIKDQGIGHLYAHILKQFSTRISWKMNS